MLLLALLRINSHVLFIRNLTCAFVFVFIALKIHVSPQTKEVLDTFGTFDLELRGEIEMKVRTRIYVHHFPVHYRPSPDFVSPRCRPRRPRLLFRRSTFCSERVISSPKSAKPTLYTYTHTYTGGAYLFTNTVCKRLELGRPSRFKL